MTRILKNLYGKDQKRRKTYSCTDKNVGKLSSAHRTVPCQDAIKATCCGGKTKTAFADTP